MKAQQHNFHFQPAARQPTIYYVFIRKTNGEKGIRPSTHYSQKGVERTLSGANWTSLPLYPSMECKAPYDRPGEEQHLNEQDHFTSSKLHKTLTTRTKILDFEYACQI
jgi:hypothetical protein